MVPKRQKVQETDHVHVARDYRDWSSLPGDNLYEILQRLDHNDIDIDIGITRFRSVCSSWRSSLEYARPPINCPLRLPLLPKYVEDNPYDVAYLKESTFYLVSPPLGNQGDDSVWLIRAEKVPGSSNLLKLHNPLNMKPSIFEPHPSLFRGSINVISCPIKGVARSYVMEFGDEEGKLKSAKVIPLRISDQSKRYEKGHCSLVALFDGELFSWRPGVDEWTNITPNGSTSRFSDFAIFKGKLYASAATDVQMKLTAIDPKTFEVENVITMDLDLYHQIEPETYLVESNRTLYLVANVTVSFGPFEPNWTIEVQVFQLELQSGSSKEARLQPVTGLEDHVFFMSEYVTFSMLARDLGWSKGDCLVITARGYQAYFMGREYELEDYSAFIDSHYFPLEQRYTACLSIYQMEREDWRCISIDQHKKLFWPPPKWLLDMHFKQESRRDCSACFLRHPKLSRKIFCF